MRKLIVYSFTIVSLLHCKPQTDVVSEPAKPIRQTSISIVDSAFYINNEPTLKGISYKGYTLEGLLPNSRMVQGIFDDLNPETVGSWTYPDSSKWCPDRNTDEFIAAMPLWKEHGLLAFTINLQGGSPQGYGNPKAIINSAFTPTGDLREAYMSRLERILLKADELEMVAIVGLFYFGQDHHLQDEQAIKTSVTNFCNWVLHRNFTNVLIEINNECNVKYDHEILQPERVHELIELAQSIEVNGTRLLVSTSYGGGYLPKSNVVSISDFVLLHGNDVHSPDTLAALVEKTRLVEGYHGQPIIFNEDDHFNFDKDWNNMIAATSKYASWGYFDFRKWNEPYEVGYQTVPVDWGINSDRKKAFFGLLKEMTGI